VKAKRGIQYDVVATLANCLVDQGFKPGEISAGAIREETGTGSLTTIVAHLKRWRGEGRPAAAGVDITPDSMAPVTSAVTALVNEMSELVREEARKTNAAAAIEAERVRAERDEAYSLNEQIEAEREAALTEVTALRAEVEAGRLREANLQGQVAALRGALARFQAVVTSTSADAGVKTSADIEFVRTDGGTGEGPEIVAAEQLPQPNPSSDIEAEATGEPS